MTPPIHIANVVSTFDLGVKNVPLKEIAQQQMFPEYQPKKFAALTLRTQSPRTTALVFSSGNVVVTGARTILISLLSSRKYARLIQKIGYDVAFHNFKVENIVASVETNFAIKLKEISEDHGLDTSWEPESFPGLVYRMPKVVFLIFRSGKVVITGGKTIKDIHEKFHKLYNSILINYIDNTDLTLSSSAYKQICREKQLNELMEDDI